MFIQPCFIRKNIPELKNKLEELGYKPFGSVKYEWDTGWGLSTDNRLGEFESFDNNGLKNIIKCESQNNKNSIDCGTNEELFLALAALRDDTDKNQWFICIKDLETAFESFYYGDFILCKIDKFPKSDGDYFRKATVEEIIEHFK